MPWTSGDSGGGGGLPVGGWTPADSGGGGGPFVDWTSPGSILSAPARAGAAGLEAIGKATVAAGKGLPMLAGAGAQELWHDIARGTHPDEYGLRPLGGTPAEPLGLSGPDSPAEKLARYTEQAPLTGQLLESNLRSIVDAEQVARAAGNRAVPGTPFGDVGELGSGPGLLGKTDLATAVERGGGGILPKLLEDAANATLITGPITHIVSGAAAEAGARATARAGELAEIGKVADQATKAAETAVKDATKQLGERQKALYDAQQAAAGQHDPLAAAAVAEEMNRVGAARESLAQARAYVDQVAGEHGPLRDAAQTAADEAQRAADVAKQRADTVKLVHNLGLKTANSPFAAPGIAGRRLLAPVGRALAGTPMLEPLVARAGEMASEFAQHRAEKAVGRQAVYEREIAKANERDVARRGLEAVEAPLNVESAPRRSLLHPIKGKTHPVADLDAQAVATMALTGEDAQLRQLIVTHTPEGRRLAPDEVVRVFDEATTRNDGSHQYTPEQIRLAMEVFGPDETVSARAAELRGAIPQAREAYAAPGGPEEIQTADYLRMRGETEPIMQRRKPVTEGTYAQAEHNVEGRGPNIEHLQQWRDAVKRAEKASAQVGKKLERAGKRLTRASEKLAGLGLSEAERANPKLLVDRVMGPAVRVARAVVTDDPGRLLDTAAEPAIFKIGQRLAEKKIAPAEATRQLAAQILKLSSRDPAKLSAVAGDLVGRAAAEGIGTVPRLLPDVGTATAPAERLGVGRERLRAGTAQYDQAVRDVARGQTLAGAAAEKLGMANRPPSTGQVRAARRLVDASNKLIALRDRVAGAADEHVPAVSDYTRAEARALVVEARTALKQYHASLAKDVLDEMDRMDITTVQPHPSRMIRQRYWSRERGRSVVGPPTPDWSQWGGLGDEIQRASTEIGPAYRDRRFFDMAGKSPEELLQQWRGGLGVGGQAVSAAEDVTMADWLELVQNVRHHEAEARRSVTSPRYDVPQHEIVGALEEVGWDPVVARELAQHISDGHPSTAAERVVQRLTEIRRAEHAEAVAAGNPRISPEGDVTAALEADRTLEAERGVAGVGQPARAALDDAGKALYDRLVAESQLGIQGRIVEQRQAQLGRAPSPGRQQGRTEGALLGGAAERTAVGERGATAGDKAAKQGQAIVGQTAELTQEAVQRTAGPIGRLYAGVGGAEADLKNATREYMAQTRALERIDSGLAETRNRLLASIEAQPRPMRPVLRAGERINAALLPLAEAADRDLGPGAGDVYRVAAADALVTADQLRASGVDPQYLMGVHDPEALASANPAVAIQHRAAPTGRRTAGTGLAHPTDFATVYKRWARQIEQTVDNETAQGLIDTTGGSLGDVLERRMGVPRDQLEPLSRRELLDAMRGADLSAWDASDFRGNAVRSAVINLDTPVVPTRVWKAYNSYANDTFRGGNLLKGYDDVTKHWKAAVLVLTGRWHVNEILGNTMMGMVGGGTLPHNYWRNVQLATRLERLRIGVGTAADRAFVASHAKPGQLAGLEAAGGFTPGAVVDQGYLRSEFGVGADTALGRGVHPIKAGWKFQAHLDNINRTAVWLGQLDKGLDRVGLADFREAFPDLAHLDDAHIQNEAAIRLSIRVLGDYKNLSSVEQGVVKRIIPFYPWLRHITKLSANLAAHHPLRVAWLMHLGLMFSPDTSEVDWLANNFDLGSNRWLTPPNWNPFDSVGRALDPGNPFGAVNPILATAAAGVGVDIKGMREVTRPPGTGDARGLTPLFGRPGELAYFAAGQLPQGRAFREAIPALLGGAPVARYQTGQPVLAGGQTISTQDQQIPFTNRVLPAAVGPLVPLLGLGYQRDVDADAVLAAQRKKEAAARKRAAAYERRRAAAAG